MSKTKILNNTPTHLQLLRLTMMFENGYEWRTGSSDTKGYYRL